MSIANDKLMNLEDGQILYGDLADRVKTKAPAIFGTEEEAYSFDGVLSPTTVEYIYSAYAFGNARYANKLNYMPLASVDTTVNDLGIKVVDRTIIVNGTASSSSSIYAFNDVLPVEAPAGNYKFHFEVDKGESNIAYGQNIVVRAYYTDNTEGDLFTQLVKDTSVIVEKTTSKAIKKIRVEFFFTWRNTYNNHRVWIGMYPADTVFTNVGEPVTDGSDVSVSIDGITTPSLIDTVQHKSNCTHSIDTKTYVDNHTQPVDFIFFRPEDYGAKGDGVTDDYAALQACIDAAQAVSDGKANAIRGYGTYRISTSLVFDCNKLDVYLNKIIYTGNDAALIISALYSNFVFESITSYGANTSAGIRCYQSLTRTFAYNRVQCSYIIANGNTVEFTCHNDVVIHSIMYNYFYFLNQTSVYGNIINVAAMSCAEIDFYGKSIFVQNGYLVHYESSALHGKIKMHNYCLETGCANGTNKATLQYYNCRFEEMMALRTRLDDTKGYVYKYENCVPVGIVDGSNSPVNLTGVSVEDAYSWSDVLDIIKQMYEDGETNTFDIWKNLPGVTDKMPYAMFENVNISANANMTTGGGLRKIQNGKMFVYLKNIAFKPDNDVYKKVGSNMTIELSSTNDWYYITPTTFDIDAASVTITLDASYCCIAINEFKVIQHTGKTCVVVDKLGNTIFDGTNLGAGVYKFKCEFVPLEYGDVYITMDNSTVKNCPAYLLPNVYNGENERWTVTKEELIE